MVTDYASINKMKGIGDLSLSCAENSTSERPQKPQHILFYHIHFYRRNELRRFAYPMILAYNGTDLSCGEKDCHKSSPHAEWQSHSCNMTHNRPRSGEGRKSCFPARASAIGS
jgi:hypothetical protein